MDPQMMYKVRIQKAISQKMRKQKMMILKMILNMKAVTGHIYL